MISNGLSAKHIEDLRKSGLSDEYIADGFETLTDAHAITSALNWNPKAVDRVKELGPCLLILYRRPDGTLIHPTEFARLKPDNPRTTEPKDGKPGKPIKYESPKGSKARLYFPRNTCKLLNDVHVPLLITEGEKKAAEADQEGFACIGLGGGDAWSKPRQKGPDGKKIGKRQPIDDFDAVALDGREVYIVYDSDLAEKPSVQWAEWSLAQALTARGAIVKVVRLPDGPPDADGNPVKVGLDDFLVAHSADDLAKLIEEAIEPQKPRRTDAAGNLVPNEAPDDPHRLARLFAQERGTLPDGNPTLYFWRDEWERWDGAAYATIPTPELKAGLNGVIKTEFDRMNLEALAKPPVDDKPPPTVQKVTTGLITNTVSALASLRILNSAVTQPSWLVEPEPFPAAEVFASRSGLVHLPNLVAGKPSTLPPTPLFFSSGCVDYGFDGTAQCPVWRSFVESVWPDDPQSIDSLQEWFGYLLLPDTRQHKLLILIGPPRSGKGTIARTLKSLIGERNIASPTLSSLAGQFGLWPLLGKTVALIPEARLGHSSDAVSVVERLLSISGEDPQDVHRKNLPTITGVRLPVRFVLMTNELPNLRDSSGAFVNRVVLLRTIKSWLGREDKTLDGRLQAELPGILNWAIEGWHRLQQRGHFIQPDSAKELLTDLSDLTSPISQFVRERCLVGPEFCTAISDLFTEWKSWCEEHGRQHVGTRESFGKDLKAKLPAISITQPRTAEGRFRAYNGIGLRSGTEWNASQPIAREGQFSR